MPHIESLIQTQRIMCLKKYVEDYKCPWKSILSHSFKNQGGEFLLHCNFNITDLSKNLLIFYRECLDAWANLNVTQVDSRDIGDKPQFCKKLYTEGITHFTGADPEGVDWLASHPPLLNSPHTRTRNNIWSVHRTELLSNASLLII